MPANPVPSPAPIPAKKVTAIVKKILSIKSFLYRDFNTRSAFFQLFEGGILQTVNEALDRLERSKFRSSFHLNKEDFEYISTKGNRNRSPSRRGFCQRAPCPPLFRKRRQPDPHERTSRFQGSARLRLLLQGLSRKMVQGQKGLRADGGSAAKIVNLLMAWIERQIERNSRL